MGKGSTAYRPGKTFSADVTAPNSAGEGFATFRREWETQTGEAFPLPDLDVGNSVDFRISVQAAKAHDVFIADFYNKAYVGQTTGSAADDRVLVHLMEHGTWRFGRPDNRAETIAVPAGSFIVRYEGFPATFDVDPGAKAKVLNLPAPELLPLLGGREATGTAQTAEMRVLKAHANMITETVLDLSPSGVHAARDALIELTSGVLRRGFDDLEPRFAHALARAAMELADRHLDTPELLPTWLAHELHVSIRSLHRAFAATGDTAAAYIRTRRLDRARLDLTAPHDRPSITEIAARWQFADSSHFVRVFKKRYGETPTQFARATNPSPGTEPL